MFDLDVILKGIHAHILDEWNKFQNEPCNTEEEKRTCENKMSYIQGMQDVYMALSYLKKIDSN